MKFMLSDMVTECFLEYEKKNNLQALFPFSLTEHVIEVKRTEPHNHRHKGRPTDVKVIFCLQSKMVLGQKDILLSNQWLITGHGLVVECGVSLKSAFFTKRSNQPSGSLDRYYLRLGASSEYSGESP